MGSSADDLYLDLMEELGLMNTEWAAENCLMDSNCDPFLFLPIDRSNSPTPCPPDTGDLIPPDTGDLINEAPSGGSVSEVHRELENVCNKTNDDATVVFVDPNSLDQLPSTETTAREANEEKNHKKGKQLRLSKTKREYFYLKNPSDIDNVSQKRIITKAIKSRNHRVKKRDENGKNKIERDILYELVKIKRFNIDEFLKNIPVSQEAPSKSKRNLFYLMDPNDPKNDNIRGKIVKAKQSWAFRVKSKESSERYKNERDYLYKVALENYSMEYVDGLLANRPF